MPDTLTSEGLRRRAREERAAAQRGGTPAISKARLELATEYERLADTMDAMAKKKKGA